jgi:uncharacterized protein YcbK (DUF882 family)
VAGVFLGAPEASAETRSLKLFFIHTGEKAEIVFKRNGKYDPAGLRKLNQFLRDWRRNEPTKMDPRLFDLVWEVYRKVGAGNYINVVSAYRSPATNSMLRSRSNGVAKKSQHMLGKAMDFFIPGVSLAKLRATGMQAQVGGVGYYPRSGSPFVHMDVGNVRHWPKMSRSELVALFPNGKTLHVPSDGKPLPGFEQAVAAYEARKRSGSSALALAGGGSTKPKSLLAALFGGGGADEDEEGGSDEAPVAAKPAPKAVPAPKVAVARAAPAEPVEDNSLPGIRVVPPDQANRTELPAVVEEPQAPPPQTPETIIAALPARAVPLPGAAPRPKVEVPQAEVVATASVPPVAEAVAPTPDTIPFGMAQEPPADLAAAPAEAAPAQQVALNIPLPTPRPDRAPKPLVALNEDQDDAVLVALADGDRKPLIAEAGGMPLPSERPDQGNAAMLTAALPTPNTEPTELRTGADAAAVAAATRAADERVAALVSLNDETPKRAIVEGVGPVAKTTRKASRATAVDVKPDRRAKAVTVEPKAARWVLSKDYVTTATTSTKSPSFAYNAVVTAPREVYALGFQKDGQTQDPHRFTGSAVKFISVARFQ